MRLRPTILIAALLALPAAAQTDVLYTIERPAGAPSDWSAHLFALPDLDGDGVGEMGIGTRTHGAGVVAWVHSGASGALLFDLSVPNVPLFFGQDLVGIDDRDGDGIDDLALIGTHSGASQSPDGWIQIHSGADGSLLAHLTPPEGIVLIEGPALAMGDLDGDGHTDVLCRALPVASIGSPHMQVFSTVSGDALYSGVAEDPGSSIGNDVVRVADHDGDGVDDFATTGADAMGSRVDLRSGRTGQVLAVFRGAGVGLLSGNNEPIVRTPDVDGDGLGDLAVGNFFELQPGGELGAVRNLSSASGNLLQLWSPSPQTSILGFLLASPGDLDLDGSDDLLTAQQVLDTQGHVIGTSLIGLRLGSSTPIFEQFLPDQGGTQLSVLRTLPGADPAGFASFASAEWGTDEVKVRRFAPEVGAPYCTSTPNSTGQAATIRALGSESVAQDHLQLEARDVVPSSFGLFFYGSSPVQVPFGQGFRCVGGAVTRLPLGHSDASGHLGHLLDLGANGIAAGSTWHFQAWFRDTGLPAGFQTSDGLTVTFLP